jgi:hypothetical protein
VFTSLGEQYHTAHTLYVTAVTLWYFRNPAIKPDLVVHAAARYSLISPPRTDFRRIRSAGAGNGTILGLSSGARRLISCLWWLRPVLLCVTLCVPRISSTALISADEYSHPQRPSKHGANIGAERSRPLPEVLPLKVHLPATWYMMAASGVRRRRPDTVCDPCR